VNVIAIHCEEKTLIGIRHHDLNRNAW